MKCIHVAHLYLALYWLLMTDMSMQSASCYLGVLIIGWALKFAGKRAQESIKKM